MLENTRSDDEYWMNCALELAKKAASMGEVPVGAIVVQEQRIIAEAFNQTIQMNDPTAHAEVLALRSAGQALNNYRLNGATLYVTLEPCSMCAGAMVHARIERLVYAASEPKAGAVHSQQCFFNHSFLNHSVTISGGVLEQPCAQLLKDFFKQKRREKQAQKLLEKADKNPKG